MIFRGKSIVVFALMKVHFKVFLGKGRHAGTPTHLSMMNNLFYQLHGRREFTLYSPAVGQYLRPLQAIGFSTSPYACTNWRQRTYTRAHDSLHRMTTTLEAGDVLLIPSWWNHEVRIPDDGFTIGYSHRGNAWDRDWRALPIVRAFFSDAPADFLSNDLVHATLAYLEGAGRLTGHVEWLVTNMNII